MKRIVYIAEGALQLFIGIGAVACGAMLVIAPDGSLLQMNVDMLEGTPFSTFMVPGLVLMLINGLGNVVSGVFCLRRMPIGAFLGMVFGFGLTIWILVQVSLIGSVSWLQPVIFAMGILFVTLGIVLRELEVGVLKRKPAD